MRFTTILALSIVYMTLTGCVALFVPSQSQIYHKDNVYIGASIGYGRVIQAEANTWISKQPDIDVGLAVANYSESSYSSLSFSPYLRYWVKSGDTPFLNVGGSLIIATGSFATSGVLSGASISGSGFAVGPSLFASLGYFGEVFSISLTALGSVGYSAVSGSTTGSGHYFFASLGLQMNFMPIRNIGAGVEICPGLGLGSGTVLLPTLARLILNITL